MHFTVKKPFNYRPCLHYYSLFLPTTGQGEMADGSVGLGCGVTGFSIAWLRGVTFRPVVGLPAVYLCLDRVLCDFGIVLDTRRLISVFRRMTMFTCRPVLSDDVYSPSCGLWRCLQSVQCLWRCLQTVVWLMMFTVRRVAYDDVYSPSCGLWRCLQSVLWLMTMLKSALWLMTKFAVRPVVSDDVYSPSCGICRCLQSVLCFWRCLQSVLCLWRCIQSVLWLMTMFTIRPVAYNDVYSPSCGLCRCLQTILWPMKMFIVRLKS